MHFWPIGDRVRIFGGSQAISCTQLHDDDEAAFNFSFISFFFSRNEDNLASFCFKFWKCDYALCRFLLESERNEYTDWITWDVRDCCIAWHVLCDISLDKMSTWNRSFLNWWRSIGHSSWNTSHSWSVYFIHVITQISESMISSILRAHSKAVAVKSGAIYVSKEMLFTVDIILILAENIITHLKRNCWHKFMAWFPIPNYARKQQLTKIISSQPNQLNMVFLLLLLLLFRANRNDFDFCGQN